MLYDDYRDAGAALNGCIILYKDDVYQVAEARTTDGRGQSPDKIKLVLAPVGGGRGRDYQEINMTDENLNYTRLQVGYMNLINCAQAVYFFRQPARRNRQGLNEDNVWSTDRNWRFTSTYNDIGLRDCMLNKYPTLKEAIAKIDNDGWESVAISRSIAIRKDKLRGDLVLSYKGEEVAWGQIDSFITPAQHQYLRQAIKEAGVTLQ